ncbi:MAG: cytochrome c biogenesis protein CcsA [Puia sp.]|nr:cytochrome c biogenesis protein CcsA [Puia sp.]
MRTLTKMLFSTRTMAVLLLIYAASMAVATFVENDYGTPVAKALIYNATWFEVVMVLLILNFAGNIGRYQLYQRKKWPLLVFHIAFILIFIGGAITRYISFEGNMAIREGEESNQIISERTFFKVRIASDKESRSYDDIPLMMVPKDVPRFLHPFKSNFHAAYTFRNKQVDMRVLDFVPMAQDSLVPSPGGVPVLHLVTTSGEGRRDVFIPSGKAKQIGDVMVSFDKPAEGAINISRDSSGSGLSISSPVAGSYMTMATRQQGQLAGDGKTEEFHLRSLYVFGGIRIVVPAGPVVGQIVTYPGDKMKNQADPDLISLELESDKQRDTVIFYGQRGITGYEAHTLINDLAISIGYGSKVYTTPFAIKLRDFQMDRYPGSNSPSSYASEVSIVERNGETPFRIYMNHVLNYKGYRFFQSSYDPDEKGTILSVNHDFWGTNITYLGYTLLFTGLLVTLFWRGTRFSKLNQALKDLSGNKKKALLAGLLVFSLAGFGQKIDMHGGKTDNDQLKVEPGNRDPAAAASGNVSRHRTLSDTVEDPKQFASTVMIDKAHAEKFGSLLVQGIDGRIEPVNTLALEIIRKLYRHDNFYNLDANQFLLAISSNPIAWAQVPFIKVGVNGGAELKKETRADQNGYTTLMNLLRIDESDQQTHFILERQYQQAFAKRPADQNNYDKEVIELNDKLQVIQGLITGQYLRFIPVRNDPSNTWDSGLTNDFKTDSVGQYFIGGYFAQVQGAGISGDWSKADSGLAAIAGYQQVWGKAILPSSAKINSEILYNKLNLFFKLMIAYCILGTVLLVLAFFQLLKTSKAIRAIETAVLGLIVLCVVLHGSGLALRWYISGHEPWSSGYEAVLFISWIGVLSGFLLYRNRNTFIPAAGCLIAVILMGFALGGSQMNPQITPLVPVLKSYWLMIHVSIITASYGFFGLSAIMGMVVLILFIVNGGKTAARINESVKELTIVNEMSLTVGLFLLTVGTFLGGIWANESWGRYWGWDPKETWAFISVIIYAFVLHIRLIPRMRGKYIFNLLSTLAFSSVIMTYFGVNYYLSGLHSYAKGDRVPVPGWVYITICIVAVIAGVSYLKYKKAAVKFMADR